MRSSEYKRLRGHFEDQDQSITERTQTRRNNPREGRDSNNRRPYNDKYGGKTRTQYEDILQPIKQPIQHSARQDYDYKNPPKPKEKQVSNRNYMHNRNNFDKNVPKQNDKLDQQMERYKSRVQNYPQKQQKTTNHFNKNNASKQIVQIDDNDQDLDLSYIVIKKEPKKEKIPQKMKHDESFQIKDKVQKKGIIQISDDEDQLQYKQVQGIKKEQKGSTREYKKQPPKQSQNKKIDIIKKQPTTSQKSQSNFLDNAFNNESQQSVDNSSFWVQEKLLQDLTLNQHSQMDSSNPNSESYVSSIRQKSQIYDANPFFDANNESKNEIRNKMDSILEQIQKSSDLEFVNVQVSITNVKNIMEAIIKQVQLVKLDMNVELTLRQVGIVVKNKEIQFQKLCQYIKFCKIDVNYPKIYNPSPITSNFIFCQIKGVFPQNEEVQNVSKFIKKQKKKVKPSLDCSFLLKITGLELKCMSCQIVNNVPVGNSNQAGLSCRECNQQMIAKVQSISRVY